MDDLERFRGHDIPTKRWCAVCQFYGHHRTANHPTNVCGLPVDRTSDEDCGGHCVEEPGHEGHCKRLTRLDEL